MSVIRVSYTIAWDHPEVSGWPYHHENGSTLYFHEFGVMVIREIIEMLQLSEIVTFEEYFKAFQLVSNGTADIGSLISSHSKTWIKYGLGSTVVFLHPLIRETSDVYFRQPPPENLRVTMLRPLTTDAWIAYLAFIIAVAVVKTAFPFDNRCQNCKRNYSDFLVHTVQLVIGRDYILAPSETVFILAWGKIRNMVTSIFAVIMLTLYTAEIVSFLALKDEFVKTPNDLIKYNYKLHTYNSNIHFDRLFQNHDMWELASSRAELILNYSSIQKVIGKDKSDPREALFSHPDGFYPQALYHFNYTYELCQVSRIKSKVKTPRSLYIRKDSPFRERINQKILVLIERGLNFRQQTKYKEKFRFHCDNQPGNISPLSLQQAGFAFLVMGIGSGVSLLLVFLSIQQKNICNSNKFYGQDFSYIM